MSKVVMANETSILAARPDELVGRLIADVLPPMETVRILDAIRQTIQTGKITVMEYEIPVVGGRERWF
jgi:hypothetical protein